MTTVLIVDDSPTEVHILKGFLEKNDFKVLVASDGKTGIEMAANEKPDLILMDIQMPEMDGYRTTAAIRKMSDPVKKTTPIIALTASAFLTDHDKASLFGMNDHVGKPFSPDELLEKIDKLLIKVRK